MGVAFYSLLHLCEGENSAVNLPIKDFRDQVSVYVKCAITLSNSLQSRGLPFTLLTNRKDLVEEVSQPYGNALQVLEIPFTTKVPTGIRFYSAHFKLDAFRYLSTLNDDYVALCDVDMVVINDCPQRLSNNAQHGIPMFYDISDQVIPSYGREVIMRDLTSIHGLDSEGRWAGGEFISGTPDFFLALTKEIGNIYDNYITTFEALHHIGDEAYTSAALELMRRKGVLISDAGQLGIVARFWSVRPKHYQLPMQYVQQCSLLHLPADKRFLASIAGKTPMEVSVFLRAYNKHRLFLGRFIRRAKRYIARTLRSKSV